MSINIPLGNNGTFTLSFTQSGSPVSPVVDGTVTQDTTVHGTAILQVDGKTVVFFTKSQVPAATPGATTLTYTAPGGVTATDTVVVAAPIVAPVVVTFNESSLVLS